MSIKTISRVKDIPNKLDFMEYLIVIRKNDSFIKAVLFRGFSGSAMQDIIPDYRKAYPVDQGYTVDW